MNTADPSLTNWLEVSELSPDLILKILPHRYPFLMVDRVLEIKTTSKLYVGMPEDEMARARVGSYARTIKNVTFNEAQFMGHFPEQPVFPGVLTMEVMAQSAAFVTVPFVAAAHQGALPKLGVVLVGFDKVRFRKQIVPGDRMEIRVATTQVRGQLWAFESEVSVDGKRAAEGSFLAQLKYGG